MNDLTLTNDPAAAMSSEESDIQAIKNLCEAKIDTMETVKGNRRTAREILIEQLRADEEYASIEASLKDDEKRLKEVRARLATNPAIAELEASIKEFNRIYNQARKDAGEYLVLYADKTGQLSFLHSNGSQVKIERNAKARIVIKKKKGEV
jgi:hypothetical protein